MWAVQSAGSPPSTPSTAGCIGHNSALLSCLSASELRELDSEGRCVITDHGAFLLFNVYIPNAGEERNDFKLRFLEVLSMRVRQCQAEGREVVVVGDLNIAATRLDHCAPEPYVLDDGSKVAFEESPSRQWWRKHVTDAVDTAAVCADGQHTAASSQRALLVDVLRAEFPGQRDAYTCWNTITGARGGNYGTRIDYILASLNVAAVTHSTRILAHVQGSDHCPVQCEVDVERLSGWRVGSAPPALCSQWWPELSGQQKKLSSFFTKLDQSSAEQQQSTAQQVAASDKPAPANHKALHIPHKRLVIESVRVGRKKRKPLGFDTSQPASSGPSLLSYFAAAKLTASAAPGVASDIDKAFLTERADEQQQQATSTATALSSVTTPPIAQSGSPRLYHLSGATEAVSVEDIAPSSPPTSMSPSHTSPSAHSQSHSASPPATSPAASGDRSSSPTSAPTSPSTPCPSPAASTSEADALSSFSRLFTQSSLTVLCDHALPAKMWQVNKKGPNHNRQFYCCSLPPPGRCDFWRWLSDVKRERRQQQQQQGGSSGPHTSTPTTVGFVTAHSIQQCTSEQR